MNKTLLPLFIIIIFISACSKKSNVAPTNNNSSLLLGSWLSVSEHDRFYTTPANALVEDTTFDISSKKYAWSQIFNQNGTYYSVDYFDMPVLDTISKAHYSVSNQIINYTYDNNGFIGQYSILNISNTNLTLEETFYVTPTPGETQDLPPGTYKCISDTYYSKQ
jgi:hypothetical protein